MNWAIAADNTVAVARFLRQKASKRTKGQMNKCLVVKLNSSHSAKKGLICDFEYIW